MLRLTAGFVTDSLERSVSLACCCSALPAGALPPCHQLAPRLPPMPFATSNDIGILGFAGMPPPQKLAPSSAMLLPCVPLRSTPSPASCFPPPIAPSMQDPSLSTHSRNIARISVLAASYVVTFAATVIEFLPSSVELLTSADRSLNRDDGTEEKSRIWFKQGLEGT